MKLQRLLGALCAGLMLVSLPAKATEQSSYVTPVAGPMSMATFAGTYLNPALRALAACNWGPTAPANGPGAAALPYQLWCNTTTNPVVVEMYDGASWVITGKLNTATHGWTPSYLGTDLGTASTATTGTSGHALGFLDVANTWPGQQTFVAPVLGSATATSLAVAGCTMPGGSVVCATGNFATNTGFIGPQVFGGTATNQSLTVASTTSVSNSGDALNLYGSTVTIGNQSNAASIINLTGASGGGITVNIAAAGNGLNALNVFNGAGSKQTWVPGGGNTTITFPTATDTLMGVTAAQAPTNKTFNCANNTCTVRIASDVSGLGTGIAAALGVNVGTAGAPVVNGGALGTPSSGVGTNLTGIPTTALTGALQAAQEPAHTNDVTNSAGSLALTIASNAVTNAKMATAAAATLKGNPTNATANVTDFTIQGLTARGAPDAANDKIPIFDNAAGTIKYVTPSQVAGASSGTVTSVTCGTGLSGGTFTTSGTCALALNSATLQATPASPTGTASATGVMMGLGTTCKITPVYSSRVKLQFYGSVSNSVVNAAAQVAARFGTGAAPANGAALTGTVVGSFVNALASPASYLMPFSNGGIITGLTPGTPYWFDVSVGAVSGGGTAAVNPITCEAMEF